MTSRENFQQMMQRGRPQWLPLTMSLTPPVADELERRTGSRDPREPFGLDVAHVGCRLPSTAADWEPALAALGCALPADAEIDNDGVVHVPPPAGSTGRAYHLRTMVHPLEHITHISQLESLPWPDFTADSAYAGLAEQVACIHQRGLVAHAGMECTVFERAWYVRGMENLFCDLVEANGIGAWLLDWHTRRSTEQAGRYARAGVDVIGLGDDIGTQRGMMMAPDFWRRHLKPRLQRVVDAIRANQSQRVWIKYHSDGDIREVLDDLIEMGIDIINPLQPECMPHEQVIPRYRDRAGFWGLVGTQTTMPFGTPTEIRQVVAQIADHVRKGAAIIIAPTHVLEPDVPWENIEALVEAVRQEALNL